MFKHTFIVAIAITVLASQVTCWHSTGHLTVARIAALHLAETEEGKNAFAWANKLLQPYSKECGETAWPFTESATWPDKVKAQGYYMMADWHYTDLKYYKPGYVPPTRKVEVVNQTVVWAIKQCSLNLQSSHVDRQGKSDSNFMKSISLRNLIHFIGDIHQPLHTTGRFSAELPDGDEGGNEFIIKHYSSSHWNNLHFIWDHLFDMGREVASPLEKETDAWLTEWSKDLMALHPYDKLAEQIYSNPTAEDWDAEGFQLVRDFVYTGIKENEEISQDYQQGA